MNPNKFYNVNISLQVTDYYHLFMLIFYIICSVLFIGSVNSPFFFITANISLCIMIVVLSIMSNRIQDNRNFKLFQRVLMAPLVFFIYSQVQEYIRFVNPYEFDDVLIVWDRFLFGCNPTVWLHRISFPSLTEFLQISYMTYFLMPLIHGIELHFRNDDKVFNQFAGLIIFCFYLSYLLYFFMPAVGPRFTLHEFSLTSFEIPGLWLTDTLREIVNQGGGIPSGALNPELYVNRDCMPSGHTMMTLMNMILAFRLKSKFRWVFLIFGVSLIFGTVYLRYHYVVDIIAGIIFCFLALWIEPKISKMIKKV
ncbi:MAG: phosphatase PAP2 family protein [bacterium]